MENRQQQEQLDSPKPIGRYDSPNIVQLEFKNQIQSTQTEPEQYEMLTQEQNGSKDKQNSSEPQSIRIFRICTPQDSEYFCSNFIRTTKYTLISWLPLATLYQYKKLANWYFLLMSILSCFPQSPWGPMIMIMPTTFVLLISVLREGIEDYARYKSDKLSNNQTVKRVLLDGSVETITSGNINVGDLIYIADDEDIPADVLMIGGGIRNSDIPQNSKDDLNQSLNNSLIQSNTRKREGSRIPPPTSDQINFDDQAKCFLQTSSLDGEKNLKKKVTPAGFKAISIDPAQIEKGQLSLKHLPTDGTIICDLPNNDLHQFNGSLKLKSQALGKTKTYTLGLNQILLKGSKLINTTNGILGIVVYTGIDTKLMQNQQNGYHKQSKLEQMTNKFIIRLLFLHFLVSLILTWQSYRWDSTEGDGQYYIYSHIDPEQKPSENLGVSFISNFLSSFLINSTFVPISLIVTLEIVKIIQAQFIIWDFELVRIEFDESDLQVQQIQEDGGAPTTQKSQKLPISYQQCKVLTSSINEELGQVRYVFSDKTGTLTMNSMEFRLCKIGHFVYGDEQKMSDYIQSNPGQFEQAVETIGIKSHDPQQNESNNKTKSVTQPDQNLTVPKQRDNNDSASDSIIHSMMSQRSSVRSTINRKQGVSYNYHNLQLEQILFGNEHIYNLDQPQYPKCNLHISSKNGKASIIFENQKQLITEFLQCIATTHECVPEEKKAKLDDGSEIAVIGYQGPSPDEVALLEFAQNHGYEYTRGTDDVLQVARKQKVINAMSNVNSMTSLQNISDQQKPTVADQLPLWVNDGDLNFKLLKKVEFSSDRKRMSVIIQDMQDGFFKMYCKGADNIIKERLKPGYIRPGKGKQSNDVDTPYFDLKKPQNEDITDEMKMMDDTDQFLKQCSSDGYRTLLVGMRVLDQDEANQFVTECSLAESDILNKEQRLKQVYDKWERDLTLLGATVLEDRLQENVQSTIQSLHQADIKVWVLTGDKLETAESIGYSCKLLNLGMDVLHCKDADDVKRLFNREQAFQQEADILSGQQKALIIESDALKQVLSGWDLKLQRYFLKITKSFETVICCRVSPKQKAEVVKLVKNDDPEAVTLAIGDGANDVSMILEADLGIGLFGKEGMRAADSSDFAINEFQHLWTLLFKQGRQLYARMSFLVIYSLYKAFFYTLMQVQFARINCYSFQTVFPDFFLTMFGTWFTAWPVPIFACIDVDIFPSKERTEDSENDLLHFEAYDPSSIRKFIPSLYYPGQRNLLFNQYTLLWWMIRGLYESVLTFFIVAEVFESALGPDGQPYDLWTMGITMFTCVMFVISFKLLLKHNKMDWTTPFSQLILSSVGNFFAYLAVTNTMLSFKNHYTFVFLWTSPIIYITIFLVVAICFLIDFAFESVSHNITTSSNDLIRHQVLKKGSEETKEFLGEFERLTTYQRNLGIIKDSVREQQIDYKRAIQAGLSQDELQEEMRLNQTFNRNIGGIRGMFQNIQGRMMGDSDMTYQAQRALKISTTSHGNSESALGLNVTNNQTLNASTNLNVSLDKSRQNIQKQSQQASGIIKRQNASQGRINKYSIERDNSSRNVETEMQFDSPIKTPSKYRSNNKDIVRVSKLDKRTVISTQENIGTPYINDDSFRDASPELEQIVRTPMDFSLTQVEMKSKNTEFNIKNNLDLTKTMKESNMVQMGSFKHNTLGQDQNLSDSMKINRQQIAQDGIINLQKSSRRHHGGDNIETIAQISAYDKSVGSKKSSSKRQMYHTSKISSKAVSESIADEPSLMAPKREAFQAKTPNVQPEYNNDQQIRGNNGLIEDIIKSNKTDSVMNSIQNLYDEVKQDQIRDDFDVTKTEEIQQEGEINKDDI